MKTDEERIERLTERWFAAQTTEAEERELRAWFRSAKDIPQSLREAAMLFGGLDALAAERAPAGRRIRRRARLVPLWGFAAAAGLLVGLFLCAELLRKPYCYIDGVAVYDRETALRTTVYFESLATLDQSTRMVDLLIETN